MFTVDLHIDLQAQGVRRMEWVDGYTVSCRIKYELPGDLWRLVDEVGFIQVEQAFDDKHGSHHVSACAEQFARQSPGFFAVDRGGQNQRTPWFGHELGPHGVQPQPGDRARFLDTSVKGQKEARAFMHDEPGGSLPCMSFFESAAVCRRGQMQGQVLGCVSWGFRATVHKKYRCVFDRLVFGTAKQLKADAKRDIVTYFGSSPEDVQAEVRRVLEKHADKGVKVDDIMSHFECEVAPAHIGGELELLEPEIWDTPSFGFFEATDKWDQALWLPASDVKLLERCALVKPAHLHAPRTWPPPDL